MVHRGEGFIYRMRSLCDSKDTMLEKNWRIANS
jgi:hypothetical protein